MNIVSWNVNGLRAAGRKGFLDWLERCGADAVFLQEIKATEEQLPDELRAPPGWFTAFHPAQRPGYSGVALYARETPDMVTAGLAESRFDDEGRVIAARWGDLHVIGAYFPNGSRDLSRVPFKLDFYQSMLAHANKLRQQGLHVVVCGDWNTAHQEIDIARPKENQKTTGFLPEEREWVTRFLADGWTDAWRHMKPDVAQRYTWWAPWQFARQKNIGWRIDFHVVDESLLGRVEAADIHDDVPGSDHCPVSVRILEGGPPRRIHVTSADREAGPPSGPSAPSATAKPKAEPRPTAGKSASTPSPSARAPSPKTAPAEPSAAEPAPAEQPAPSAPAGKRPPRRPR